MTFAMYDKNRIFDLLNRIDESIELIKSQRDKIKKPEDFISSQTGMFLLSGICMQLIFIGESVKVIDKKTNGIYLTNYPDTPWIAIMGLRNLIAHQYHRIDEEEIFNIIYDDLDRLQNTIELMKFDLTQTK